jgi:hypothetical protein
MSEVQQNVYTQGMRLPGRHRHKWDSNINKDQRRINCEDVTWTEQVGTRSNDTLFVTTMMSHHIPQNIKWLYQLLKYRLVTECV